MPHYILISGKAEGGKDTTAQFMKERLEQDGKKVYILHYADHLKEIAKTFYGWDGKKNENGRSLLQALGDNNGKIKSNNKLYYVEHLITLVKYLLDEDDYIIIPDARYPFEIDYVKASLKLGDTVTSIRVVRPNFKSSLTPEQLMHESEVALDDYSGFNYYINNHTLEELKKDAYILCDEILYGRED